MPKGYKIIYNRKPLISELLCFFAVFQLSKKKKSALILKQKANCSMSPWLILPVAGVTPCYHEQN